MASRPKDRQARKFRIVGRVQGVGFRYFAVSVASSLGITGYVRNCDDGSVEVFATGDPGALDAFRDRLAEGPRSARIIGIEETEQNVDTRYKSFVIEGSW